MSRSWRKAFYVLTGQIDKSRAHKQARCKVKAELKKPEPDENVIMADTRGLAKEEWGTVFDLEFDCDNEEEQKKARRK